MKCIFGAESTGTAEYKKFVSVCINQLSKKAKKTKLANTSNSILSYMAVDNYSAIFVDWSILAGNYKIFQEQLVKLNRHIPLIIITNDTEINSELFISNPSLFRVINQTSLIDNISNIIKDIRQYFDLLKTLPLTVRSELRPNCFKSMVGNSDVILSAFQQLAKVSQTDFTTLILGESGCGKELAAKIIHDLSSRNSQKLVSLNCAAIPSSLQESELFGYVKGAFTDANYDKRGKFELANNGTLFFDEIGDMPLDLQSKLLRVLESGEFNRLGGNVEESINVRYIAATNQSLSNMVKENSFRLDLFHRLNVIPIVLPRLNERGNDLVLLCINLIGKMCKNESLFVKSVKWDFIDKLKKIPMKGNVRELENILTRTLFNSSGSSIDKNSLEEIVPFEKYDENSEPGLENINNKIVPLNQIEKVVISKALNLSRGNVSNAAKALEISRSALYRKIKKYKLE